MTTVFVSGEVCAFSEALGSTSFKSLVLLSGVLVAVALGFVLAFALVLVASFLSELSTSFSLLLEAVVFLREADFVDALVDFFVLVVTFSEVVVWE